MKKLLSVFMAVLLIVAIALPCSAKAESEAFLTTALNSGSIYAQQQNTILVRTDDGTGTKLTTISKILGYLFCTEKDYNYFYTFVVEKDGSGKWRVTQANNTLALGAGNAQAEREVPEGGFIIAFQGTSAEIETSKSIVVGDYVVLVGVDLEDLSTYAPGDNLTGASASFYHDDGTVEPPEESAPAESTPEESAPGTPETGDNFVIFMIVAVIAAAGVTTVIKVRR